VVSVSDLMNGCFNIVALALLKLPRSFKQSLVVILDVCFCILATWLAFYLRLDEFVKLNNDLFGPALLSIAIALPIFAANGLYRAIFRYSGWPAVLTVGRAIILYAVIYMSIVMAIGLDGTPRTLGMIQPLLLFFVMAGSRVLARYFLGSNFSTSQRKNKAFQALIYGTGSAGRQLATALNAGHEIRLVGFLDDDDRLHGHVLKRPAHFSPDDLGSLIESKGISHVLMAIPSASRRRRNEI
jgi:FlaA1/EpsC-like NDP-sugar epimerase